MLGNSTVASKQDEQRIKRYMQMRQITIQYLRMLEDELIALGGIRPQDRACTTRDERREMCSIDLVQQ
jgi:hypothetical protein